MSFKIEKKKKPEQCTAMTIRLDKTLLAKYDELASRYSRTRTEVVVAALEYAIEHIDERDRQFLESDNE